MDVADSSTLELLALERPRFVAFARNRVATGADAEDVVQQAYSRATEKLASLREPDRAIAWMYRVLRRLIADQYTRRAMAARKLDELAATMSEAEPEETASCACALGILGQLRPEHAEIVRRVDLDDEPVDQVALGLGITPNNAHVRLHRARHALRDAVEDVCGPGLAAARRACADCDCPPPAKTATDRSPGPRGGVETR